MKFYTPILLIILSVGLFFWYVQPQYYTISDNGDQLASLATAQVQADKAIAQRDSLINKYNNFDPNNLSRIKSALPDSLDTIKLIVDVGSIANKYGVNLGSVRVSSSNDNNAPASGPQGTYGTINLGFTVTLSYTAFQSFLSDLGHSLRITDVTNISFTPTDTGTYTYTVSLKTYWLR